MILHIEKEELIFGINTVQRAMAVKSTLPVLEGIYICADAKGLQLICTDLSLGIQTFLACDIEEEGKVVLPGRLFAEIVRKLPDGDVDITIDDNLNVTIQCMGSRTKMKGLDPETFPDLAEVSDASSFTIAQPVLKDMIRQTIFAVATDETRPILTGALLEIQQNNLTMVALDGYRLALRKEALSAPSEEKQIVIPGKSLSEIGKLLDDDGDDVHIMSQDTHVMVEIKNTRVIARLLDGEFIKYRQIMPTDHHTRVQVAARDLFDSIDRASLMAREGKNNLVRFQISENKLILTSNSEMGDVYEEIPIAMEGQDLEIAFNARYFTDELKIMDDETINLDFTTNISPCVVNPVEGDKFSYLVLPVRIY